MEVTGEVSSQGKSTSPNLEGQAHTDLVQLTIAIHRNPWSYGRNSGSYKLVGSHKWTFGGIVGVWMKLFYGNKIFELQ